MSVLLLVILSMAVICFIIGCIRRPATPDAPWFTISLGLLLAYVAIPAFLRGG